MELERTVPGAASAEAVAVAVRPGGAVTGSAADADAWLDGALTRRLREGGFRARADEEAFFPAPGDRPHVIAVGLGDDGEPGPGAFRSAAGRAVRAARRARLGSLSFALPGSPGEDPEALAGAVTEGLLLGDWSYDELRGPASLEDVAPRPGRVSLLVDPEAAVSDASLTTVVRRAGHVAGAQNYARSLVARPPNLVTPRFLAREAERLARELPLRAETWGPERLREEGFGGLLAVARGSTEEPRFVILEHAGSDGAPVVLAGKGVTFDAGGISLKPAKGMEEMKYDMAGAAAVLGAMRAVASLELPLRVVGLIPTTENLPSGSALKPSEVIRGVAGTSIEVVNTDAEGRLILSDALAFGRSMEPRAMLDVATLTGGCVVALGKHAAGLMSNDDALAMELEAAGRRSGERTWRLPLWKPYRRQLDSEIADIKNSGGREASAITAGWFLREFVGETPWVHLDIAGTAWADEDRDHQPEGATGVGVRLITEWLSATR